MSQHPELPMLPARQPAENTVQLQNAKLAALHELALDLTSTFDLNNVLQRIAELTQLLSASAHAHVFLYDPDRNELQHAASHWSSEQRAVPLQPRRTGITYAVASTGQPEFIEDTAHHPAYVHVPSDMRPGALACLPLAKGERILGTLNLGYWEPHPFDAETRSFLTLCYMQFHPLTGELVYVNAGHNPPLLLHRDEEQFIRLARTGMTLGVDETSQFDQRTVQLDAGDLIVLYTDGVTDASNATEQDFGAERLRQVIFEKRLAPALEMVTALNDTLRQFVGAAPQFDDIAVVVVKRL